MNDLASIESRLDEIESESQSQADAVADQLDGICDELTNLIRDGRSRRVDDGEASAGVPPP